MIAPQTLKRLAAEFREYTEYELAIEALCWDIKGDTEEREADAYEVLCRVRFELQRRGTDGR